MSRKPIVVGVDASPEAAQAAAFAARLAERAGTSCQLVHATRDALASLEAPNAERYQQAVLERAGDDIRTSLRGAVSAAVLDKLAVRFGAPAVVLKEVVATRDADLVVLGGKHHSALGRWLGGSTSLNVARTTDVPVLVTAGPLGAVRRVLVAVDLSGAAPPTLAAAERYAALFGAQLRALSVLEPIPTVPDTVPPDLKEYYALCEETLESQVWALVRTPGAEKVERYGMAVETILREATAWEADLLVVGSHGKGWAQRLLVGSVTERLLNHLPTSLLVVPPTALERARAAEASRAPAREPLAALA